MTLTHHFMRHSANFPHRVYQNGKKSGSLSRCSAVATSKRDAPASIVRQLSFDSLLRALPIVESHRYLTDRSLGSKTSLELGRNN